MIAIVDYGAGNLGSVKNALDYLNIENEITADPVRIHAADRLILPGVGAFPDAMRMLRECGLAEVLQREAAPESGKPLLGICLGMQMLFEASSEFEETAGLSLLPGRVDRIPATDPALKIPHMGYNELEYHVPSPLLAGVAEKTAVYFVHSYMAFTPPEYVAAYAEYGVQIPALVQRGNVFGTQYHPEKSGEPGLRMLWNFAQAGAGAPAAQI